jgi:PAS domain S-box-containing protein
VEACFDAALTVRNLQFSLPGKKVFFTILFVWAFSSFTFGNIYSKYSVDTARFHQLIKIKKIHSMDSALMQLDSAERLARKLESNMLLAEVFVQRGNLFFKNNRLVMADSVFRMARAILVTRQKDNGYLLLLKKLAICNYYLGSNPKVLNYTIEGLSVSRELNNVMFQGTFNNISGIAVDGMGDRAGALKYYFRALNIFNSLKDQEKIASVEMNIGVIYEEQNNFEKAKQYYNEALLVAKSIRNDTIMSACYNNLANIYSERNKYKMALDYTFKSLALSKKTNDLFTEAMDLSNIGDAYENLKDYDKAFDYYEQALRLSRKIQSNRTISISLSNLADIYEKRQNIPLAIRYATEALGQNQNGGDVSNVLASLKQLQHLYALKGDYKKAYDYMYKYANLRDSVFSNQNESRLAKVQMDYAFRVKDQSLKLAREKQKIIQAYLIVALFALLLVIGGLIFLFRIRSLKTRTLKKRIQFVDNLLENSEGFVLMLDNNLKISYLSPSYQKTFGHYLKERKGANPFDFVHPDEKEKLRGMLNHLTRGETKRIEFLFRLKNSAGEYRFMQGVFNNRLDNPDLNAFVLNFWDITELRKTQQAISQSEKKYYEIFNAFPDIYFRIDMDGVVTEISPSVSSVAGFDRREVMGKLLYDFVEIDMAWEKARKILFRLNLVKDFNLVIRTKNGKKINCSLNVHDVKDNQGETIGFEGVLRDISARVVAEKRLQKSESELKEANASKDKILSIIGHDLLGPIGTQKSILDMVIDDVEDFSREEILRLLQSMKPSLDATFTMIENLLSWARIMRRSIKPNLKPNDISRIVEKSFDLLNQQAEQKGIKLIYDGEKEVPAVFDKNLIEIVIRNLLSNAIKFSNPDSEIRVTAVKREDKVEVSIADQGRGLSKADIEKILKEKEKMESKLGTRKEKGTGLGLIVVKEFIQHNNGQLHIESKPGQGTTFSFLLPAV